MRLWLGRLTALVMSSASVAEGVELEVEVDASFLYGTTTDAPSGAEPALFGALVRTLVVLDPVGIEIEGGFADWTVDTPVGDFSTGIQGTNLLVAGHYFLPVRVVDAQIGLGVSVPTASASALDDEAGIAVDDPVRLASPPFGSRDLWLFTPGRLGVLVPTRFETSYYDLLRLDARFTPFALIPVVAGPPLGAAEEDRPPFAVGVQTEVEGAIELPQLLGPVGLDVGVGISQVVYWEDAPQTGLDEEGELVSQVAVEPFIGVTTGPVTIWTRLNINVDPPFGPSFSEVNPFGLRVQVSLRLD